VRFINLQTVKSKSGDLVVMNRQGSIAVVDEKGRERERYAVVYGAKVKVKKAGRSRSARRWSSGILTPSPS
jgi:DNA-directed RNA polymerase subunit beta'